MIYVVMVWDLEVGWQQTERMNVISFREIMEVHWFGSSNKSKWEFVEQEKGWGIYVTVKCFFMFVRVEGEGIARHISEKHELV